MIVTVWLILQSDIFKATSHDSERTCATKIKIPIICCFTAARTFPLQEKYFPVS
jgi:hypothetical protein